MAIYSGSGKCLFDTCDRGRYCKGYCVQHYKQFKAGRELHALRPYRRQQTECQVLGCDGTPFAQDYCKVHYMRVQRTGSPEATRNWNPGAGCSVDGCGKTAHSLGYCTTHYARVRRHGEAGTAETQAHTRRKSKYGLACKVEGCERKPKSLGWCQMHYGRWKRSGGKHGGDPLGKWGASPRKSQGYVTTDGYVMSAERRNGRSVLEHRLVLEQMIGRPLHSYEDAHHKNGVRNDNRPENLELWVNQPRGQRVSELIDFVVQTYPDEVKEALAAYIERHREEVSA